MLIYTGIELDIAKILHDRKEMVTAYTPKSRSVPRETSCRAWSEQ